MHMIRDGRDVAVSVNKEGWIRPFPRAVRASLEWSTMKVLYPSFFEIKQWLKSPTPLGKFVSTDRLRLGAEAASIVNH
jgi:hypothetical protein